MPAAVTPISNPPSPWHSTTVEWLGEVPPARLQVFEDRSKSILSSNDSPDIPFRWSVNPYRGCMHGCSYCYARPTHQYLDWGAGTDFDRKIAVKMNAAGLLTRAFERRSWRGELVVFSGVTDCYQPLEATYGLTRQCLEVCVAYRNPVGIVTKGALVERDLDLLEELHRHAWVQVSMSIPFWDPDAARRVEPLAPPPRRRMRVLKRLADRGIPVQVNISPIIPGLTDQDIPTLLKAARDAGATSAGHILVRLPREVAPVFRERMRRDFPLRAGRILSAIEQCRDGRQNDPRFGHRMRGQGARWAAIESVFETWRKRLGYRPSPSPPAVSPFRRPPARGAQLPLL